MIIYSHCYSLINILKFRPRSSLHQNSDALFSLCNLLFTMLHLLKAPTVLGGSYSHYKMLSQNSQRPRRANHHKFNGSCHCGNIHVVFTRPTWFQRSTPTIQEPYIHCRDELTAIPARACGCSFCTKHRAAWTSNSRGSFQLNITEPSLVAQYRPGTKPADYTFAPDAVSCRL